MTIRLRDVLIGMVIAVFFAYSATAAPPLSKNQNRAYGNSAGAAHCEYSENGYRCMNVYAFEEYDVKGAYEFTRASTGSDFFQYDPVNGSSSFGWRYLSCPVDKQVLSAQGVQVVVETTLDPDATGCESWGQIQTCDAYYVCQYSEWRYEDPVYVAGWWVDPADHSTATVNMRGSYYDPWSETSTDFSRHCRQTYGYAMRDGAFFVNDELFWFEGYDNPSVWSDFQITSCNNNTKQ